MSSDHWRNWGDRDRVFLFPRRGKEGRDLFEIATMQARGRNNARHPRLPRAAGARENDSMAPRVRIPTRHELPNDASLLSAPLPPRRVAARRDGTGRDDERSKENRKSRTFPPISRGEIESMVETRMAWYTRSLEAF